MSAIDTTGDTPTSVSEDLTPEESRVFVEAEARRLLGFGIDEFIRRLDAGEYDDIIDVPGHWQIGHLEMLSRVVR